MQEEKITEKYAIAGVIITIFVIISILGFVFGLLQGGSLLNTKEHPACTYQSLISINPGYYLGCEITKKRFNLNK